MPKKIGLKNNRDIPGPFHETCDEKFSEGQVEILQERSELIGVAAHTIIDGNGVTFRQ